MDAGKVNLSVPEELVQFIKTGTKFIIAGHIEPDGDCVGSQIALRSALKRLGKEAIVCSPGPFKRSELKKYIDYFVSPSEEYKNGAKVIITDCSGKDRIGDLQGVLEGLPCAVIDHHAAVKHPPSTQQEPVYVDAASPSCTLLIQKLITALGLELTQEEAILLLLGICTDTGFFRHLTENNADVFEAVSKLIQCGVSPKKVYQIMNGGKPLNSRILLGRILARTESHFDGKLLLSYETQEEYTSFGMESRDSDNLNNLLLSVEGVEAVVIIRQELADNCTVGLRSIDKINVSEIAASLGGGGHKNASGLTMQGDIPYVKQKMLEAFSNVILNK